MVAFNIWAEDPPPLGTWVWAKYTLTRDDWSLVRTCETPHCCVFVPVFGAPAAVPTYWRPAGQVDYHRETATQH